MFGLFLFWKAGSIELIFCYTTGQPGTRWTGRWRGLFFITEEKTLTRDFRSSCIELAGSVRLLIGYRSVLLFQDH